MRKALTLLSLIAYPLCLMPAPAGASETRIFLSSGTGFFITGDGYLMTSLHVVKNCQKLTVRGAVSERNAEIVARDADHDLALLKVNVQGVDTANFSTVKEALAVGDRVIVVGYPGEAATTGITVTKEAQVVATSGPRGEGKWIQLDDVLEQGNSGGPLMDSAGNVIGIVAAKAIIYTYLKDAPEEGTTSHSGMAVSIGTVREFLDDQRIYYREADSGVYNSTDRLTDNAHRFLVNVRCQFKTETR